MAEILAPVIYRPGFLMEDEADEAFERLDADLPWGRHGLPRDEVYFNDTPVPYTYGSPGRERTYMPEAEYHPVVSEIRRMLEANLPPDALNVMDVCFLNRYIGPRDQLGWHADDSPEMDPLRPIVTVSLGAVRDIQFRPNDHDDPAFCPMVGFNGQMCWLPPNHGGDHNEHRPVDVLELGHGSAAIMKPRMQQTWQHRIPKSSRSDIGTRISLTFRGLLVPCAHCNDNVAQIEPGLWAHRMRTGLWFEPCGPSHLTTNAAPRLPKPPEFGNCPRCGSAVLDQRLGIDGQPGIAGTTCLNGWHDQVPGFKYGDSFL